MKKKIVLCLALSSLFCLSTTAVKANTSVTEAEKNFRNTPENQKLAVYWYWLAGNISKEGVVNDLRAMKSAGINRAQIGIIGEGQGAPQGPVKTLSNEWWEVLHQALKTAGELNIE